MFIKEEDECYPGELFYEFRYDEQKLKNMFTKMARSEIESRFLLFVG